MRKSLRPKKITEQNTENKNTIVVKDDFSNSENDNANSASSFMSEVRSETSSDNDSSGKSEDTVDYWREFDIEGGSKEI